MAKPKYAPVDMLGAVFMKRKADLKLKYEEMAEFTGVTPEYYRKMFIGKPTREWNPEIKRKTAELLGLKIQTVICDSDGTILARVDE